MTFADEVKATVRQKAPKADAPVEPAKVATPTPNATPTPAGDVKAAIPAAASPFDLPVGQKPVDPAAIKPVEAAPVAPVEPVKAAEPTPAIDPLEQVGKKPIKIGTREFTDVSEALEYAKELERQTAENNAYIEGVKDASVKVAAPDPAAQKTAYEKFSEEVFADPVAAAKNFSDAIKKDIFDTYNASIAQQTAEVNRQREETTLWENFYKSNPDLSSPAVRKIIERQVVDANWDQIKDLHPTEGFKKIAELARAEVTALKKSLLPTVELNAGGAVTTSVSGDQPVAPTTQDDEKPVDFISALNQLRKRGKK